MRKKKELKGKTGKELDLLVEVAGRLLRKNGIWVLPLNIRENKDGTIRLCFHVFPAGIRQEGDQFHLPTQTIMNCKRLNKAESGWSIYKISEDERKEYEE